MPDPIIKPTIVISAMSDDPAAAIPYSATISGWQGVWVSQPSIAIRTAAGAGWMSELALPGGTTSFLRADGAFAAPAGSGNVTGPVSSTDGDLVQFNGTGGTSIKDGVTYATGSFTPTLTFGGVSTGITYSTQYGSYLRIGSYVHFILSVALTAKGSATGALEINALPFTSNAAAPFTPCVVQVNNVDVAQQAPWQGFIVPNASKLNFNSLINGAAVGRDNTHATNTTIIRCAGHYPL